MFDFGSRGSGSGNASLGSFRDFLRKENGFPNLSVFSGQFRAKTEFAHSVTLTYHEDYVLDVATDGFPSAVT